MLNPAENRLMVAIGFAMDELETISRPRAREEGSLGMGFQSPVQAFSDAHDDDAQDRVMPLCSSAPHRS
jgi:hypothetical protein